MMKNYRKIVISGFLTLLLFGFVIYPIYNFYKYSYNAVFDEPSRYLYLFSEPENLNALFSGNGQLRPTDSHFVYMTKDDIILEIIEFVELNDISFNLINFEKSIYLQNNLNWDRMLNYDVSVKVPVIGIKDKLTFNQELNVNFNKNAPLEMIVDKPNCKAYYGRLLKMILSGDSKEPLILYDFTNVSNTIITFYKTETKLLLIIITSDKKEIRKEDLEILNLQYTS